MSKFMLSMGLVLASLTGLASATSAHALTLPTPLAQVSADEDAYKEFTCFTQEDIDYYVCWLEEHGYSHDVEAVDYGVWRVYGYKF